MYGVDLVGVDIVKNHPTLFRGPGGHLAPPAGSTKVLKVVRPVLQEFVVNTIYYQSWKSWSDTPLRSKTPVKTPKIPPNRPKLKKTRKSSEWRHIYGILCPKN